MRKSIDKVSSILLRFIPGFIAFFVPLFFLNITSDPFTPNKQYVLFIAAGIALLAWSAKNLARGKITIASSPALLPLFLLAVVSIISTFWNSASPYMNFFGTTSIIISLFIIFLTVSSSQKKSSVITATIYSLIASATILSLFSIVSIAGVGKALGFSWWEKSFTPAGSLPSFLTFTIPVMLATIAYSIFGTRKYRFAFLPFAAIMAVGVATSIFSMSTAGDAGYINLPLVYGWSITTDNIKNWHTALLGSGPESYLSVFQKYRPVALNQHPILWNKVFFSSSNYILTILNTLGILGLTTLLIAFTRTIFLGISDIKESSQTNSGIFALTAMISGLIILFILPSNIVGITLGVLSILLYTLDNKINGNKNVKDYLVNLSTKKFIQHSTVEAKENMVLPVFIAVFSVVSLYYFWSFAGNAYRAAVVSKQAITNATKGDIPASYAQMIEAYKLDSRNPEYHSIFSQSSMAILLSYVTKKDISDADRQQVANLASQAIREGRTAIALNPASSIYWEQMATIYAQLYNNEGFTDSAIAFYGQAIQLNPSDPTLRIKLGNFYYLIKDYDQAIRLYEQADSLKQSWPIAKYNIGMAHLAKGDSDKAKAYLSQVLNTSSESSEDYQKAKVALEQIKTSPSTASATPKSAI